MGKFATNTLFSDVKSLNQNKGAQIYSNKAGFATCYPVTDTKGETLGNTLRGVINDWGIPRDLTFGGYSSQVGRNI